MALGLRLLALPAVALLGALPAAHAQTRDPSSDSGRTAGWVFTPSVGMGGTRDDNVLLVNPADRPPPDYASPISSALSLDYTGRRTQFSSNYSGSWVFYRRLETFNSFDQSLRLHAQHRATSRLTIFAQEQLTVAPTTDAVLLAGVPFYRIGTLTNAVSTGFDAALSARTSIGGGYTLDTVTFDRDDPFGAQLRGGHAHQVTLSLERAITPRLSLGGAYLLSRAIVAGNQTFDDTLDSGSPGSGPAGSIEDRFNIQRGSLTAQYRTSPTVTVTGSVGLAQIGAGLAHEGQIGPTWGVGINRRGRQIVLAANYQQSYVLSFGFGGTSQNQELTGSVLVPFARRRAYVSSSLSWSENDPLGVALPSLRAISAGSVLGYRATRWLNAEGYYIRTQQDTQLAGGQLSRNQLGFRLVAARPVRLR
jgi:hypothetical protein